MRKLLKHFLWIVLLIFILDIGIAAYMLVYDLKSRFPHLDFSRTRFGVASWYSKTDKFINLKTANGEIFDDKARTCASWDYPFNQKLLVINPLNGKWVVCRVNDRGPAKYLKREIDLTKGTFKKIANLRRGLIHIAFLSLPEDTSENQTL